MHRRRTVAMLRWMGWTFAATGLALTIVTLVDGLVVYHQYWFLLTEQFGLAIAASVGWVAAANCWLWKRYLQGLDPSMQVWPIPGVLIATGAALFSVILVVVLVYVFMILSAFLPVSA